MTSHTLVSPCIDKSYLAITMKWQVIPWYHHALTSYTLLSPCIDKSYLGIVMVSPWNDKSYLGIVMVSPWNNKSYLAITMHWQVIPWYHHEMTSHTLLSPCIDKSYLGIVMQWQVIPCYHRACQTEWQTQRTRLVSVIPRQRHQGVLFLHTASDVKMTTIRYTGGGGSKNSLPSRCSEVSENFKAAFYRFDIYPYSGLQTLKKI